MAVARQHAHMFTADHALRMQAGGQAADHGVEVGDIAHGDFEYPAVFAGDVVGAGDFQRVVDGAYDPLGLRSSHTNDGADAVTQRAGRHGGPVAGDDAGGFEFAYAFAYGGLA